MPGTEDRTVYQGQAQSTIYNDPVIAKGLDPNATIVEQIAAHRRAAEQIRSGELVRAQTAANDLRTKAQNLDPSLQTTEPGMVAALWDAYSKAQSYVNQVTDNAANEDKMAENLVTVQAKIQGKDQTPEEKAATQAATGLAQQQTSKLLHDIAVENEKANLDKAQADYDRDPNNPGSATALKAAQAAYQGALTEQAGSSTRLNDANATAQGLQNDITAATGLEAAQWGIKQTQANVAQTGANTANTEAATAQQLFETSKGQQMLPYDIAVQAGNAESLGIRNERDRRTNAAGGPESDVASTQSGTALNLANAAKTTLDTQQAAEGARITQLRQIAEAVAKGTVDPASAFDLYTDARTQSTAFDRDKQATAAGQNFMQTALSAGIFAPKGGVDPGGGISKMLGRLGGFAPDTKAFQPMSYGDFAAQAGVNLSRNVPMPSGFSQSPTGLPIGQGYQGPGQTPIDMPIAQYEQMLTQAKTAAGQAVSNMQPISSMAQASQPSSGAQQPNITINLGQGAQSPAAPVPPPPVTHVTQPFAYDPAYGPSPVAPPSPMTRAFGGSDLVLPPIARGYRPVWRQ